MCGIFGSPTLTPSVRQMLPYLGIEMEDRGKDAWGASNGQEVVKHVGPLTSTWHQDREQVSRWEAGIFHTRGATTGTPRDLPSAHPFMYQKGNGEWIIGIHNGVIYNHDELNKKYNRKCSVDSMHIWRHRAEGLQWDDLRGWGNLVWWEDGERGRCINFARFNSDNLNVCQLEQGEFVFCSLKTPVVTIAQMLGNPVKQWFPLDEYHQYSLALNGSVMTLWKQQEEIPFIKFSRNSHCGFTPYPSTVSYDCYKCIYGTVKMKDQLLCERCLEFLTQEFLRREQEVTVASI